MLLISRNGHKRISLFKEFKTKYGKAHKDNIMKCYQTNTFKPSTGFTQDNFWCNTDSRENIKVIHNWHCILEKYLIDITRFWSPDWKIFGSDKEVPPTSRLFISTAKALL